MSESCWGILVEGLGLEKMFNVLSTGIESEDDDTVRQVSDRVCV